jgi:hypothetical protein
MWGLYGFLFIMLLDIIVTVQVNLLLERAEKDKHPAVGEKETS